MIMAISPPTIIVLYDNVKVCHQYGIVRLETAENTHNFIKCIRDNLLCHLFHSLFPTSWSTCMFFIRFTV